MHGKYSLWFMYGIPDSKVHGANMGPTWVLSAPDGPHVGPMNLVIRDATSCSLSDNTPPRNHSKSEVHTDGAQQRGMPHVGLLCTGIHQAYITKSPQYHEGISSIDMHTVEQGIHLAMMIQLYTDELRVAYMIEPPDIHCARCGIDLFTLHHVCLTVRGTVDENPMIRDALTTRSMLFNLYDTHPKACPWVQGMGCPLCVQNYFDFQIAQWK